MKKIKDRDIGEIFLKHLKDIYECNKNKIMESKSICADSCGAILLELLEQNYSYKSNYKRNFFIPANNIKYNQKRNNITINFPNDELLPAVFSMKEIADIKIDYEKKTFSLTIKTCL